MFGCNDPDDEEEGFLATVFRFVLVVAALSLLF